MEINSMERSSFPGMCRQNSYFQNQHKNLLASSWHAVHIMEEEKKDFPWMIAGILPDLFNLLQNHCMLEEDFMILSRYPDYFWHQKEHAKILHDWRNCGRNGLSRSERLLLIVKCTNALARHIGTTDNHLRDYAAKYDFPDELSILKMYGIRYPASSLFPGKKK